MVETNSEHWRRVVYRFLVVGYGFAVALAVMLLSGVATGVVFLSLQCLCLIFIMPVYLAGRSRETTWAKRLLERFRSLLRPLGFLVSGAVAAFLASFVTPIPASRILLASVFAAAFGILVAGICAAGRALLPAGAAQAISLAAGLLMVSTPYYVNSLILATSGALRMRVVQLAVDANPLLVGTAGIMGYDWLRSPHLYQRCLIGGYQYPFYYPSAAKVGIIFAAVGIILMAASVFRRANPNEDHS